MKEHLKLSFIGIAVWWILLLPFDYTLFDGIFKLIQKPFIGFLHTMDEDLIFETEIGRASCRERVLMPV